jgi:CRISPR-associated protein Cmr4
MKPNYTYLFLLSPLHTGGATQEGNLLGIAREAHTELPYIPSSTIRGRLRASLERQKSLQFKLFGTELNDTQDLTQGDIWIGDGSLLWIPVPSLSHGVVWVSSPMLLRRWARFQGQKLEIPPDYSTSLPTERPIYLKDAMLTPGTLQSWQNWQKFVPTHEATAAIDRVIVLPDRHYNTLVQMSLWRQVKVKLDQTKTVEGGFRYEEAIPPDSVMYYTWGLTAQADARNADNSQTNFTHLLEQSDILQIGGQESLGRGFVQQWHVSKTEER